MNKTFEDTFNLLCGDKLGSGVDRDVFECRLRPDLVVKVEIEKGWRSFANSFEMSFYDHHHWYNPVGRWLAPCEYLSPDGRILLQKRCSPVPHDYKLPSKLPKFLTDHKRENFGILDGRLVCLDYASVIMQPSVQLVKANW